jgi:hypothetical protein
MNKAEERRLARKVVRAVARAFRSCGFLHTKPTFMVRPCEGFVQFVHLSKKSYGPSLGVCFGIRVMNDPSPAVSLNGPSSNSINYWPDEDQTLICTGRLIELVQQEGIPWFSDLSNAEALLSSTKSPLVERDRLALLQDMSGQRSEENWQRSEQLLGLPREAS